MVVYLRRRSLLLFSVVHTNIPLRLPLRNVICKSSIHRRSIVASVPLLLAKATEGAGAWLLRPRCCTVAVVPLLPAKAREGAGASLLLRRRCCTVVVVPLLPAKAREEAGAWLLLRRQRCTVAAVVPLLPAKAREWAGAWLLLWRQRCTVAAVVPLLPAKAREGAGGWLLLRRQCYTVAAAVVSHERFRTKTMTTAVLRRRLRDTRRAHLRLVPGSYASLAPDSRSRAAVMWPQLLWLRAKQMLRWGMTVVLLINYHRLGRFVS